MKLIHTQQTDDYGPYVSDVNAAVEKFYAKFQTAPNLISLNPYDMQKLLGSIPQNPILVLESGKNYCNYIQTICGPIKLNLVPLDTEISSSPSISHGGTTTYNPSNIYRTVVILVENDSVDKEFEKHILGNK